jgi:hypothetical protein
MKNLLDTAFGTILAGVALTLALWLLARWLVSLG